MVPPAPRPPAAPASRLPLGALSRKVLLVFGTMDLAFLALILPAFAAIMGHADYQPLRASSTYLVAVAATAVWLLALAVLLAPVSRWESQSAAGRVTRADITKAADRFRRLPMQAALLWSAKWVLLFFALSILGGAEPALVSLILWQLTMLTGPLPLGHSCALWLVARQAGEVSLVARQRSVAVASRPMPLHRRLVLYSLTLCLAPTLYMASVALSPSAQQLSPLQLAWLVSLFFAATVLFAILCAILFASTVTEPLSTMTRVVQTITTRGAAVAVPRIPQGSPDEIGTLIECTNSMIDELERVESEHLAATESLEHLNRTLEQRVAERSAEVKEVLDNVGQGFLSVEPSGFLSGVRSAITDHWFGEAKPGVPLWDYLGARDPGFRESLELGWSAVMDGVLPLDLCIDQLPTRSRWKPSTYRIRYRPVIRDDVLTKVVVVVSDITQFESAKRSETEARELASLLDAVVRDPLGAAQFISEGNWIVEQMEATDTNARRLIHTLKGNCSMFGIRSVVRACHEVEEALSGSRRAPGIREVVGIREAWNLFARRAEPLAAVSGGVLIPRGDLRRLRQFVREDGANAAIERRVADLMSEPFAKPLGRAVLQIQDLAQRLDKGTIDAPVDAGALRFDPERWSAFWAAFVHVVRNVVDHGIESTAERKRLGKSETGRVSFTARQLEGQLVLEVEDDGRGIDWATVASRAHGVGLPTRTCAELVQALFHDGVTSRSNATEISGRGTGLSALKQATTELGGTIEVESTAGVGSTFRFRFPDASRLSVAPPPIAHPVGLRPDPVRRASSPGSGTAR